MSVFDSILDKYQPRKSRGFGVTDTSNLWGDGQTGPTMPGVADAKSLAMANESYSPDRSGAKAGMLVASIPDSPGPTVPDDPNSKAVAEINKTEDDTLQWVKAASDMVARFQAQEEAKRADRLKMQQDSVAQGLGMLQAIPGMNDLTQKNNFRTRGLGAMAGA